MSCMSYIVVLILNIRIILIKLIQCLIQRFQIIYLCLEKDRKYVHFWELLITNNPSFIHYIFIWLVPTFLNTYIKNYSTDSILNYK